MNEESKHKKKKSHKHKKSKKQKNESEDSEASGTEWVEFSVPKAKNEPKISEAPRPQENKRDDWMLSSDLFGRTYTRKDLLAEKQPREDTKKSLDPGQHSRELNPYWRDGGDGLPPEKETSKSVVTPMVGDSGLGWLERAYQRAVEQAKEERRTLEEVAAERWGSLKKLEDLIAAAKRTSGNTSSRHYRHDNSYRREKDSYSSRNYSARNDENRSRRKHVTDTANRKFSRSGVDNRSDSNESDEANDDRRRRRGSDEVNDDRRTRRENARAWKKPTVDSDEEVNEKPGRNDYDLSGRKRIHERVQPKWKKPEVSLPQENEEKYSEVKSLDEENESSETTQMTEAIALSDEDMNKLGARILKAELMGDEDEVLALKKQLDEAQKVRKFGTKQNETTEEKAEQVLFTDQRGLTRPFVSQAPSDPYGGRSRKAKKRPMETHDTSGMRIRYFADDDKCTLQEMFEREKMTTAEDQNALYSRARKVGSDPDFDVDEMLITEASMKNAENQLHKKDEARAVRAYSKMSAAVDKCSFCFDGSHLQKHLVVATATKVFLRLPHYHSLIEGHCQIIPMNHVVASTHLDEDVWEEVQNFKKALLGMFRAMDKDAVFFETSMYRKHYPHMVIECVPLPQDTSYLAPMYFKKAILESETEWAHNKKLVELKGRDIRRAVPKELPYFCVNFGMDGGFAHVIENEHEFPKTFAQETIAGMLDLDHQEWRRPSRENFEQQRSKVLKFTEYWKPHDWTESSS